MLRPLITAGLLGLAMVTGCHTKPQTAANSSSTSEYKTYKLRGKIVSTNAALGEAMVNHQAIPGFMEAMTMPYKLRDPSILSELHPGDLITADLLVSQNADADVVLDHVVVVGQGKPDYVPKVMYHVPAAGDAVPDFKLRNQDGRTIHLGQFKGEDLLISFIYTRCPLPNFCPLVTHHFADIERRVKQDPGAYGKTHLVCVSFDPEHDTPDRLRAYGASYIGSDAKGVFADWDFAVPEKKEELTHMAQFFDVGFSPAGDGSITHTLSTTLIGRDGKVLRFYPGNDWTVEQVLQDVKQTAGS